MISVLMSLGVLFFLIGLPLSLNNSWLAAPFLLILFPTEKLGLVADYSFKLFYGCYIFILAIFNPELGPYGPILWFLGVVFNSIVMAANKLKMPACTTPPDNSYVLMTDETRLNFLGDWIWLGGNTLISIGDIFIFLGIWICVVSLN